MSENLICIALHRTMGGTLPSYDGKALLSMDAKWNDVNTKIAVRQNMKRAIWMNELHLTCVIIYLREFHCATWNSLLSMIKQSWNSKGLVEWMRKSYLAVIMIVIIGRIKIKSYACCPYIVMIIYTTKISAMQHVMQRNMLCCISFPLPLES